MLVDMEPGPTFHVEATTEFAGPWWLAVALLGAQTNDVVGPELRGLASLEIGPMVRAGTEGRVALHWIAGAPVAGAPMKGELRIVEIDGNHTQLTLTGDLAGGFGTAGTPENMAERLARRIETTLAREIGTQ